jgi:multidrug efflux pump subunit AcrA (membrane-fusion protein)
MAAGCVFLVAACSGEAAVATQKPAAAIAVEVLNILASGAGGDIRASGLVAYKRETALGFGAPGEIESILADVGDRVAAGQVLATMRRTTTGADASEAALARLTAKQNFERVTRLHAAGAASQAELDNAKLALERARERVSIVAPAGGIVLQRDAEPGQNVAAGQRVLSIGESRTGIIVEASMTASEVSQLRVGDVASVNIRERAALAGRVAVVLAQVRL